jgi:predicted transcriptional regulator YdeE
MAYILKEITIRTNNSADGMKKIEVLWQDISTGKLPLLFDSDHVFQQDISPVAKYSNFENDEHGDYDLSIIAVTSDFFQKIETEVIAGTYKKYGESGEDNAACARNVWWKVWSEQKAGEITRTFSKDYECSVPAEYSADGKAHCVLYIAVK